MRHSYEAGNIPAFYCRLTSQRLTNDDFLLTNLEH